MSLGQVLYSIRIGSDGSRVTNGINAYNTRGMLVATTNALGGKTTYTETMVSGKLVRTTTNPDTGTSVETHYKDGQLEKITGTATHPARYDYAVETGTVGGFYWRTSKETKLTAAGATTSEWVKNITDHLGRPIKTIYAPGPSSPYRQNFYDSVGKIGNTKPGLLWKTRDLDGVVTLFQCNAKGEAEYVITDMDRDNLIDWSGPDRIRRTVNDVTASWGTTVQRTRQYVYPDASSTPLLISTSERSADGLRSWQTAASVVTKSHTVYSTGGYRYLTNIAPDLSYSISTYQNGRLSSVVQKGASGTQLGSMTYLYDTHGREWKVTDARNGTTTVGYNIADMQESVTTPTPGTGQNAQTTVTLYDSSLRTWKVIRPDGGSATNEYFVTGLLKKTSGAETYPVEYTYDAQGRLKTMKTWTNLVSNPGTFSTTTWNYEANRGWLSNKRYANYVGPDYTYTAGGKLKTRTWARGTPRIVTTYSYGFDDASSVNDSRDMVGISYSNDGGVTPGVAYTYDRRGRQKTAVKNGMTTTFTYNDLDQVLSPLNVNSLGTVIDFDGGCPGLQSDWEFAFPSHLGAAMSLNRH